MYRFTLSTAVLLSAVIALASAAFAQGRIELEIAIQQGGPLGQEQQWLQVISRAGLDNVRMNSSARTATPSITESTPGGVKSYRVVGVLNARGQLVLPGGTFSLNDEGRLRQWAQSIRADGPDVALAERHAFGLTAQQLVDLNSDLGRRYAPATRGARSSEVVAEVQRTVRTRLVISREAQAALQQDHVLEDEMQGLGCGTVLAAALRPLGLVFVPQREQGGPIELSVVDSRQAEQHWPIGWPPQQTPSAAAPSLFEHIEVEIRDFVLRDALDAIEARVGVPFLYDYNSLERRGVDLSDLRVSVVSPNLTYSLIIQRLLRDSRAGLRSEIRQDEENRPFVWIWAQ